MRQIYERRANRSKDSLCALSLRCMPTIPYPLENVRFPLDFPLPATSMPLLTNSSQNGNGRTRNSSSINISFDNAKSSDEEDGIDEDDEGIMEENGAGFGMEKSDDEDGNAGGVKQISLPLPKSSKLTPAQLKNYQGFFKELFDESGTRENGQYLKNDENWKNLCKSTKMAMPNRQILPIEMFLSPPGAAKSETLCKTTSSMRKMIVEEMDRTSEKYSNVVYDLDSICFDGGHPETDYPENVGKLDGGRDLIFESRFESGNLRRATQVAPTHYELMLTPDMNQLSEHFQWFFFQVSNTRKDIIYTFEIANCLKPTSMYSQGMQPVMFSIIDKNEGWKRCGYNVCYYRNLYACTEVSTTPKGATAQNEDNGEEKRKKHYYSMRFNIVFPNTADVVYIAYHFPYTYSFLSASIHEFRRLKLSAVYCREDVIGHSIAGNPMRMLTISSPCSPQELAKKEVIVLTARVHPGESNASWMMHGILEQLLTGNSTEMYRLREKYLFKVIPMLNPDGVINGSHRCSLAGIDLNRVWDRPNDLLHPEVYHTKAIVQFLCDNLNKRPLAFVDLHGHSKKWDYFVYGNNPAESWRSEDAPSCSEQHEDEHLALPRALETVANNKFNASECRFSITRAKEASARVNIWRQFGVTWAYTLESTYCGFNSKGCQINMGDLKDIGRELLFSFLEISNFSLNKDA
ncbi:unnamed protein product [Caenorhabditis angaria]|uniref:Peptidase M14 domain-containing protein n=1 Tax=Caenorhabditis angaria TaxID=860376 RepID=A0A9P1IA59_9PELO|nr:unnamed protein product [Caenorhabditis angaria]